MSIGVGSRVSFTSNTDPNGGIHGTVKSMNLSVTVPAPTGKGGLNLSTNSAGASVLWDGSVSQQQLVPLADLTQQNS
jgi:hypothetical protein